MSVIGTIHEDVTTEVLGKIGCWQWLVTFASTMLMMAALFNHYEDMFLLKPAEWLVFCDPNMKIISVAIVSRFGLIFGCVIFGLISDSFGRKTAIIINVFAEFVLGLVITFCDSEGWFRLLVFLKSLMGSANLYMGLILICEIASNAWRTCLCMIVMSPRLLAIVGMVPLANSAPISETYSIISCIFTLLCIVLLRWIPESPQWLLFNRKTSVAEEILLKAAKKNGIKLRTDFKIRPVNHRAYNSLDETATCVRMLSIHNIKVIFSVSTLFWIMYYFQWSSLYVRMYSEEHMNNLPLKVFCFASLFGCLSIFSCNILMLRHLLLIHILIKGAFTIAVIIFNKGTIRSFLSSIALASGIVVHALILNITPRLFGINIRVTVVGCCHATGQLGSIISYLLFLFNPMSELTSLGVELSVTLILVGLSLILPDVDKRELPDVTEDMDYFSELSKPLRWATQKTSSPSLEEILLRVYSYGSAGQSMSTHSHSEERIPARPIGFAQLWRTVANWIRQKFVRRITHS